MSITHRIDNDVCIFTFDSMFATGSLDLIRQAVEPMIQDESIRNILFNFRNVQQIDSMGIGVILEFHESLYNRHAQLHFCEVNEYISDIFDVTNIDTLVVLHPTEAEALSQLKSRI